MNLIPLVDGDLRTYVTLLSKKSIDWLDAVSSAEEFHQHLLDTFNHNEPRYFITGNDTWRYSIATIQPYKGNRKDHERPLHYEAFRELLVNTYKAEVIDVYEADDAIASAHIPGKTVIVSHDKDMTQLPGHIYNTYHNTITDQSQEAADLNFWCQMLVGDTADNVPGIIGIGKGKAPDRLEGKTVEEMRQIVLDLYIKQYGMKWGLDAFNEVYQLLRLKTDLYGSR